MPTPMKILADLKQGSQEWHDIRKTKITATDAAVIMGISPWKTINELYHEKKSNDSPTPPNARMQRGIDLEAPARDLFNIQTGLSMYPTVVVRDWAMASLDGMDDSCTNIVEIKCPGEKDHAVAVSGKIPDHYYPQLQHQMWVCDVEKMFYFSFDGTDGVIVEVVRDAYYLEKMIEKEKNFYECLVNNISPQQQHEENYIERTDATWKKFAMLWKNITQQIKDMQIRQKEIEKELIALSSGLNTRGAGISLCHIHRDVHQHTENSHYRITEL